jgi:hypothetical protein
MSGFTHLWHHRSVEILQNRMFSYLYSQRLYGPYADLHRRLERKGLKQEWDLIKNQIDASFAELDKVDLELANSQSESPK